MENKIVEYDDLLLSAYLILSGFTLLRIKDHPHKQGFNVFVFAFRQDIGEAVFRFYGNQAQVEPRRYLNLIRDLKRGEHVR